MGRKKIVRKNVVSAPSGQDLSSIVAESKKRIADETPKRGRGRPPKTLATVANAGANPTRDEASPEQGAIRETESKPPQLDKEQAAELLQFVAKAPFDFAAEMLEADSLRISDEQAKSLGQVWGEVLALYAPVMTPETVALAGAFTVTTTIVLQKHSAYKKEMRERRPVETTAVATQPEA